MPLSATGKVNLKLEITWTPAISLSAVFLHFSVKDILNGFLSTANSPRRSTMVWSKRITWMGLELPWNPFGS